MMMLGGVMAASGCLDGDDDDDDDKVTIPDDRKDAKLTVGGSGDAIGTPPVEYTIREVVDMGLVDFQATFVNSVGTTYTANYTGVPLADLVDSVEPDESADLMEVEAFDGYVARLFLSDVDETTYLALKEDGEWNDLVDAGAFRLVDTDLPSTYWVKMITDIRLVVSEPLVLWSNDTGQTFLSAGWVHSHATREVSWQEGEKTRTYDGVPMADVVTEAGLDIEVANHVSLVADDDYTILPTAEAVAGGVLLVDSRGDYVYVQEDDGLVVKGLDELSIDGGFRVTGSVGAPYYGERRWLAEVAPAESVDDEGTMYTGPKLSWLVAEAAPDADADAVRVSAGDGYSAVFPIATLGYAILAHQRNFGPLDPGDGPLRVIDLNRSGNFHVGWVVLLEVYASEPVNASGSVNVTDVLDIGFIASNADTEISYNDGRRDRTYDGLTWDAILEALDASTNATSIDLVDADGEHVEWNVTDLVGRTDSGICVDARGDYVAYNGDAEEAFFELVAIDVS